MVSDLPLRLTKLNGSSSHYSSHQEFFNESSQSNSGSGSDIAPSVNWTHRQQRCTLCGDQHKEDDCPCRRANFIPSDVKKRVAQHNLEHGDAPKINPDDKPSRLLPLPPTHDHKQSTNYKRGNNNNRSNYRTNYNNNRNNGRNSYFRKQSYSTILDADSPDDLQCLLNVPNAQDTNAQIYLPSSQSDPNETTTSNGPHVGSAIRSDPYFGYNGNFYDSSE